MNLEKNWKGGYGVGGVGKGLGYEIKCIYKAQFFNKIDDYKQGFF